MKEPLPAAPLDFVTNQKRAKAELEAAQRHGITVAELNARFLSRPVARSIVPTAEDTSIHGNPASNASTVTTLLRPPRLNAALHRGSTSWEEVDLDSDEEEGGQVLTGRDRPLSPIAECREISGSVWLHFPHVELLFLFFAFEGAVAAQLSAMWDSECWPIRLTALAGFVSIPRVVSI